MPLRSDSENFALIRVIGVGGGGSNAVNRMIRAELMGVEFIAVNTDAQALLQSDAPNKIRIGDKITRGLGAGGDPSIGQRAAEEDSEKIADALRDSDLVFITAGMGGGTGSGAAPVIAEIARDIGALTIGVVTKPFSWEGARRRLNAEKSAELLRDKVDTLITIPNDRLKEVVTAETSIVDAFRVVNPHPDQYTWWSNRGRAREKNVGWRLDYMAVTPGLRPRIRAESVYRDVRFSDHAPLTMDFDWEL